MNVYEVVGWAGAVMVVGAYVLVTLRGTSVLYHVLNLLGALGLLVNALHHGAIPSSTVNVVWAFIAVAGIAASAQIARSRPSQ